MGAVSGQELVPELFSLRQQPFEEVVVPAVAVAPREADQARDGVCLEHGAHDVLRHPEPVLRRSVLGLEIERRQRALRVDPPEHALGHRGVLHEDSAVEPGPLAAPDMTEPGELARRDERQRLVGRLEDLTAFVEQVAPGGLVAGDARMQHEVVAPAGDRDRVELDRPELPEDLEHPVEAPRERPRRREEVPGNEKATRRLSSDLHLEDASCAGVDRPARTRLIHCEGRRRTTIPGWLRVPPCREGVYRSIRQSGPSSPSAAARQRTARWPRRATSTARTGSTARVGSTSRESATA